MDQKTEGRSISAGHAARGSRSGPWAMLLPLIAFAGVGILTWPVLRDVARRWLVFEQSYSHGLLILLVSLVLVTKYLFRLRPVLAPSWSWGGAFLAFILVYLLGHVLIIQAFQQLVLLPLFWSVLAVFWGWRQARHFIIPLGLLFFALPIWETLRMPLQMLTAGVNHLALGAMGIEFVIDGLFVELVDIGVFEIARGCSGLNYLLVGLTLGLLMGEQHHLSLKNRGLLLLIAAGLSLLANWIRVFVIIYVGYATHMESPLIRDHATFGWIVFAVLIAPLFWVGFRMRPGSGPGAKLKTGARPRRAAGPFALVAGLLGLSLWLVAPPTLEGAAGARRLQLDPLPDSAWAPLFQDQLMGWKPEVHNPDAKWLETFVALDDAAKQRKNLLIGLYRYHYQRPGAELVQYGNALYPPGRFRAVNRFSLAVGQARFGGVTVASRAQAGSEPLHLVRGYFVNGHWYASPGDVKSAQLATLFGGRPDAALLVIGLQCGDCAPKSTLQHLMETLVPRVNKVLSAHYASR